MRPLNRLSFWLLLFLLGALPGCEEAELPGPPPLRLGRDECGEADVDASRDVGMERPAGGGAVTERLCIRCKRPATRQTVIDVAVGPLAFCSALCEQLWGQAAAEREGWRS